MDQLIEGVISGDTGRLFGGGGGGFGGGGGGAPVFQDRPGETPALGGGGGRGGRGGAGNQGAMRQVFGALRDRGMGFGALQRRGQGGGGAPVEPGVYSVSMTVGERTLQVPLEVVRADGFVVDAGEDESGWLFGADSWAEFFERLAEAGSR